MVELKKDYVVDLFYRRSLYPWKRMGWCGWWKKSRFYR